jgi:probable rRNA maturation factor
MKHKITLTVEDGIRIPFGMRRLVKKAILAVLSAEKIGTPCCVSVLMTGDDGIRSINAEHRGLDRATDTLSFPLLSLAPGEKPSPDATNSDPDTGLILLGDIVISLERAKAQAGEYGHSVEREAGFLAVHSTLHLLGYDHVEEAAQKQMRAHEESVLTTMGLKREV